MSEYDCPNCARLARELLAQAERHARAIAIRDDRLHEMQELYCEMRNSLGPALQAFNEARKDGGRFAIAKESDETVPH